MTTLVEIEAAVNSLPLEDQLELARYLNIRLKSLSVPEPTASAPARGSHSVLDIQPFHVEKILRPFTADDDLLEEMLEGRHDPRN